MLKLVTDTAVHEDQNLGPQNPPVYQTPKHFNLADHRGFTKGQPFDYFRTLRESAPVAWVDMPHGAGGFWAVTRYEDIKKAELDPETFSNQLGGINITYGPPKQRKGRLYGAALNALICLDRPNHIELRMQHRSFFTPEYVAQLKESVDTKVDSLLDEMDRHGPTLDMVEHFSEKLPLFTLCEMLGIDEKDRPKILRWMSVLEQVTAMAAEQQDGRISPIFIARVIYNMQEMFRFGQKILADRRKNPRDDLLTTIAQAEVGGEPLSQEFLDGSWLLIIFAGNDTTRNSLSGTMRLLTRFPDQKQKLLKDPSKIAAMVPEALRMVSPVMHMRRTTTCDTELGGQKIAKHEKVVLFYGSANHDLSVFDDPDTFDIDRPNASEHLAFGLGPHVCLGQRVAMMQLESAYRKILERFPNIEWTGRQEIQAGNFVHGIKQLEVDLGTG